MTRGDLTPPPKHHGPECEWPLKYAQKGKKWTNLNATRNDRSFRSLVRAIRFLGSEVGEVAPTMKVQRLPCLDLNHTKVGTKKDHHIMYLKALSGIGADSGKYRGLASINLIYSVRGPKGWGSWDGGVLGDGAAS